MGTPTASPGPRPGLAPEWLCGSVKIRATQQSASAEIEFHCPKRREGMFRVTKAEDLGR